MLRALWIYADEDPVSSGELRRLGLPALAMESEAVACELISVARVKTAPPADVAVFPLAALAALPGLSGLASTRILVEVDWMAATTIPWGAAALSGLSNRIAGVVARGAQAAAWAVKAVGPSTPVRLIVDPAARKVELAAAALRFGLPFEAKAPIEIPPAGELWFAEPGDHIDLEEVRLLAAAWQDQGADRLIVAPRFVRTWLKQSGVGAASIEWTPSTLDQALRKAGRCAFFGPERYGQARRRVQALRAGVSTAPPASPPAAAFEPTNVAAAWREVITAAYPLRTPSRPSPVNVLLFLDLIQDLDPILPILDEMIPRSEVTIRLALTNWLRRRSPRVLKELDARGFAYEICDRPDVVQGAGPSLDRIDAVVAVAESNLPAHARTHALFARARALNIPTFAVQHGVENVGLHLVPGEDDATVGADHMFVWFPRRHTPVQISPALRPRLVHVGRPEPKLGGLMDLRGAFATFDEIVSVFENLHWSRYEQSWRVQFLNDCANFAFASPNRAVILKPHHAGLWSVKNRHLIPQWPSNLIVADPTDPFWEPYTASALVQISDTVVTTPSTAAVDAVQAGRPVAVAAYGLDLPAYAPLRLLHQYQDWLTHADREGAVEEARRRAAFLARTAEGDQPARAIVDHLLAAARERRHHRAPALILADQALK